jgi:dephospho-CoA kinase
MILVGLTGGIGSGKSTASKMFAARGAVIIDADAITHEVQRPGMPVLTELADAFGSDIIDADGALIRPLVAQRAFADAESLQKLNQIVHPAVQKEMLARMDAQKGTDNIVILDVPLLVENPRSDLGGICVIDCPLELAVERLVEQRNMNADDARARMSKQATREERRAAADFLIENSGDLAFLEEQVDRAWEWMQSLNPISE